MIGSASFQPQAAAFTSLLHMCAKAKLWQKALEVRRQHIQLLHPAPPLTAYNTACHAAAHSLRVAPAVDQPTITNPCYSFSSSLSA